MNQNQPVGMGPAVAGQKPIVLNFKLTPEEATLILNKLNTAQFTGFTEAQMALAILGKIQNAEKVPVPIPGPSTTQMDGVRSGTPTNISNLRNVLGKQSGPINEAPEGPPVKTKAFTPPPVVEPPTEEISEQDEEDNRPGAPLTPLGEAKSKIQEVKEDEEEKVNIPPEDAPAFGVVDNTSKKKDATNEYI